MPALRAVLVGGVRLGAALAALAVVPSCGGSSGTSSSPPPPPVATALDFVLIPMVNGQTVVEFDWTGSGASSYTLEVGSSSGQSDVGVFDVAGAASYTWNGAPVGNLYARVKGRQGATVGAASSEVLVGSIDARDMIDALIFGNGPLAVAGNAAGPYVSDRMQGWQPGTGFEVILGESVPANVTASIEKTVQQVGPATKGQVQARVLGRRPDPLPLPRPGEVTVSMLSAEETIEECDCDDCQGCAWGWNQGSFILRGRILISSTADLSTAAHEIGHDLGLAHVINAAGVRPPFTMGITTDGQFSPGNQLDVLDPATVRMLETLYGAGLTAGASRRQFEALGLVPPEPSGIAPRPRVALKTIRDGLETIVIRPLCGARP